MENSKKIKDFLKKNQYLFWHIPKDKIENVSLNVMVEYVINYGDYDAVKEMFKILGVDKVAEIFYKSNKDDKRTNYNRLNKHFFELYFDRHASRNIKRKAKGVNSADQ